MNFPDTLKRNGRKVLSEDKIHINSYLFARHKEGPDWEKGNEFPDWTKIKTNQSFNWSAFSIPTWVRFDPELNYMKNYGVMSYRLRTIKNIHNYCTLPKKSLGVKHEPLDNNYSHCELYINIEMNRTTRREFRYALKITWIKKYEPQEEPNKIQLFQDHLMMFWHKLLLQITSIF